MISKERKQFNIVNREKQKEYNLKYRQLHPWVKTSKIINVKEVVSLYNQKISIKEIAKKFDVTYVTIYNYLKKAKQKVSFKDKLLKRQTKICICGCGREFRVMLKGYNQHRKYFSRYCVRKFLNKGMNKAEKQLDKILKEIFPNEYKFVGDFSIVIDNKSPDFININGQKKIIELFGNYWHQGEEPQDRINCFKPYGYNTLVVWESELKNKEDLKDKLLEFHNRKE